jgi:hypothetical protein
MTRKRIRSPLASPDSHSIKEEPEIEKMRREVERNLEEEIDRCREARKVERSYNPKKLESYSSIMKLGELKHENEIGEYIRKCRKETKKFLPVQEYCVEVAPSSSFEITFDIRVGLILYIGMVNLCIVAYTLKVLSRLN